MQRSYFERHDKRSGTSVLVFRVFLAVFEQAETKVMVLYVIQCEFSSYLLEHDQLRPPIDSHPMYKEDALFYQQAWLERCEKRRHSKRERKKERNTGHRSASRGGGEVDAR